MDFLTVHFGWVIGQEGKQPTSCDFVAFVANCNRILKNTTGDWFSSIGDLRDDIVRLLLPESFRVLLSCANYLSPGLQNLNSNGLLTKYQTLEQEGPGSTSCRTNDSREI